MTAALLLKKVEEQELHGMNRIVLTVRMPKDGPPGKRVKTPFGEADVLNWNSSLVVFSIETEKVRDWLFKHRDHVPGGPYS